MIERINGSSSTISSRYGPRSCAVHEASLFIESRSRCCHFRGLLRAHRFLGGPERDRDRSAAADLAVDPNRALVGQDHALAQRQSESDAGARGLGGEEWIEDALEMFARDSDSVIHDLDQHPARFVRALSGTLVLGDYLDYGALGGRRVGGVEEQVEQHLLNFVVIGEGAA